MHRTIRAVVIALAVAVSLLGSTSAARADGGKTDHTNHRIAPIDITWE
ncbi:MAG: hypothetical protein M3Z65_05495 [Chloroflexota bacterium]|nr:hypothetical protein [Chloroflexota bacterium]